MNRIIRKLTSLATAVALGLTAFTALPTQPQRAEAAAASYKFDFGSRGTQSGYIGVSASTGYNAGQGYGFNTPGNMKDVNASGSGALSDAVQFVTSGNKSSNTFNVDLDKGLYQVSVWLGDTMRTSVAAEGMLQLINLTGNNAYDTFQIPVTDGQLNLNCTAGKEGYAYTLSALEITKISDDPTMKPTIWLCGDSTVCNYYPLESSQRVGWGQVFGEYIDTSTYQIRNMAASGQFAKGFVTGGQFDAIEAYGKPGDLYYISIGINDTNYSNADEYYQVVTDMTKRAKAKGMTVILVKQQGRADDISRNPLLTGRWFGGQLDQVGSEQSVQVIDLFNLAQNHFLSIGQMATSALYDAGDTLHFNRSGARVLADLVAKATDFAGTPVEPVEGAVMQNGGVFMLKNVGSGLYLDVAEAKAENQTNVQQWGANAAQDNNSWKLVESGQNDGYYYLYSMLDGGDRFLLDVEYAKAADNTNISIYEDTDSDAQLYKFQDLGNGTFAILTKVSSDRSAVTVADASTANGGNVVEFTYTGKSSQKWTLEPANTSGAPVSGFWQGDVNGDQVINGFDVAAMKSGLMYGFAGNAAKTAADINGDGSCTVADLILLSKYVLRQITEFPSILADKYYAVDATYYNAITETTNAGYTGESYLNLNNEVGSYVQWNINVPTTGNYLVTFRVANGSTANRQMKLEVNNGADYWMQDFLSTNAWTTWVDRGIVLPLTAGSNTLRATSYVAEGGPNIDYITLEKTDEPIAEVYVPATQPPVTGSDNPTIYIAGDSTVQTYRESYAPQQGWGAVLGSFFGSNVTVANHSIAGRSSKSFYDNGRLDTILNEIKSGDYLMVQFGINDAAYNKEERYAPVCGNAANPTNGSFEFYINKYVEGAIAKGATPILVTTVIGLKAYANGKFVSSYDDYCKAMKSIAARYSVPCIDLNTLMVNHYNTIGYDAAYQYHMISAGNGSTDMTHFTEKGATAVAKLVAVAMKGLNLPISAMCTAN